MARPIMPLPATAATTLFTLSFGVDPLNNLYLLDVWRGQKAADIWIEALCDLVQKYRPLAWAEEGGQIKSGIGPFLDRQMRERRVYVNRTAFPPAATNLLEQDRSRAEWHWMALLSQTCPVGG